MLAVATGVASLVLTAAAGPVSADAPAVHTSCDAARLAGLAAAAAPELFEWQDGNTRATTLPNLSTILSER